MGLANYKEMLTVIVVTYHSDKIVERLLNAIEKDIQILVVENSLNEKLKTNLEKKFENVTVLIPRENLGNGGGINMGFRNVKTRYSLYLDVDTIPQKNMIEVLIRKAHELKNFSILAPKVKEHYYADDLYIKRDEKNNCHKVNFITGCALLFDMNSLKKIGYFDENIFLYYEEHDLYQRSLKNGLDIYLIDEAEIIHEGSSGINKEYNDEIRFNRNWHYCWSKFYYFRKNFGYFYGIRKTLPNFFKAVRLYLFFKLTGKKEDSLMCKAEMQGLITSYLLRKSSRRPKIK